MKTVLVTGASSGFGALMVEKFAKEGWYVYATARDLSKDRVKEITKLSVEKGLDVEWVMLDVTNKSDIKNAYRRVVDNGRGLDVLVNNAGFGLLGPFEEFSMDDLRKQFEVNYFGVASMMKEFLPLFRDQGRGTILNISSIAGLLSVPMYSAYSSSKHALEALSEAVRNEVKPFGINICLVEPGTYDTNFGNSVEGRDIDKLSPYYSLLQGLIGVRNQFHDHPFLSKLRGRKNPMDVVNAVYRLAGMSNPPLRTLVGGDAKFEYFFRRLLPSSVWDWVIWRFVKKVTNVPNSIKRDI